MTNIISEHIDVWMSAQTPKSSGRGNGSAYGIKKLRELILELAVRGKLVPQDPNSEPASILLEKIAKEKARLIKEGKIKKEKSLPEITDGEKPFDLPLGWEWTRLGNLSANIHYGYTASADHGNAGIRLLRITDIQNDSVNWETVPGCEIEENKASDYRLENGDILIARTGGTIGKSYLVENINIKAVFASYLIRVKRIESMYTTFIKTYLGSQLYWRQLYENSMGTGQPNVNATALKRLLFPMPPLVEQNRIVAKVDELMALCDQLEQQQNENSNIHQALVETLLGTLTETANHSELESAWQHITENFDTLLTTEESIDLLKKTILQLAVMGKLVPQDPKDEPAKILLEKIAKEKARLIKEGKIKKDKPLPEIADDEKPFALPHGWEWSNLTGMLALVTDGDHQPPPKSDSGVPFIVIGNLNSGKIIFNNCKYVPEEYYRNLDWGRLPVKGDILYTVTGSYGITILVDSAERFCVQRHVAIFKSTNSTPRKYLSFVLRSAYALNYATKIATGIAQKTVPLVGLRKMPIPVAPEKEQHRIIAKVDELMALCDTLKARLNEAQTTQVQLADAIVAQAVV